MPEVEKTETDVTNVRLKTPTSLHHKIIAHQKMLRIKRKAIVEIDEAYIDLIILGIKSVPYLAELD